MLYRKIIILIVLLLGMFVYTQELQILTDEQKAEVEKYTDRVKYYTANNQLIQAANYNNKIAYIYWQIGNLYTAIDYFKESAIIYKNLNKWDELRIVYSNIGLMYTDVEDLEEALEYHNMSLKISREMGKSIEIASSLVDVSYILSILKENEEANELLNEALTLAAKENNPPLIMDCYNLLSENYNIIGDIRKAEDYKNKYTEYKQYYEEQKLKNEFEQKDIENQAEIAATKSEIELTKQLYDALKKIKNKEQQLAKLIEDSLKRVEQDLADSLLEAGELTKIRENEISKIKETQKLKEQKQRLILISISGGLLLVLILVFIVFRNLKYQQKTNKELEAKNSEIETKSEQLQLAYKKIEKQNVNITKSINYAQGIQKALLPKQELLNTYIPESFILFRPRDIVSGDFYWFAEIESSKDLFETKKEFKSRKKGGSFEDFEFLPIENNKFAISAVDCTGHGVPGAFMSMIGYNSLDEIIASGISRADLILNELHKSVRRILKQDITENRDGMDMALCVINRVERTVNFAGAENPILYIQNGEIVQIKGDRNPIGGLQTEQKRVFTGYTIKVDKPTSFYIFSDGFIDQFGGTKGRKFLISNLRKLLFEIHKKPMKEQKNILENTFKEWIGTMHRQIDDVLIIGFKLG